jgi:hypothetical protein
MTTHENIEARQNGFDVSELPKTFRDAVKVAQNLGGMPSNLMPRSEISINSCEYNECGDIRVEIGKILASYVVR